MKRGFFTEGNYTSKIPRNHSNMRTDVAWVHVLDAMHQPIFNLHTIPDNTYDFGIVIIPKNKEVKVHDSNADMRYLVLPERPSGTENWDEEELSKLISRDHLVGIRVPTLK